MPSGPGQTKNGFVLPNGWTLTPVGKHIELTDLPLNILPLGDGKHALVATSGFNKHELSLVELAGPTVVAKQAVKQSWFGLVHSDTGEVWWSGGGNGLLHTFTLIGKELKRTSPDEPDNVKVKKKDAKQKEDQASRGFKSGLLLDEKGGLLYSLNINLGAISALDRKSGKELATAKIGGRPYDLAMSRNRTQLFVSDWAGRTVLVLNRNELRVVGKIPVGDHPNQIAAHPKDDRLFVACASSNSVAVIDSGRGIVTETIFTALFPRAPEGSTPDALAVSPDGKTLYVANADNNCVAVIDIREEGKSQVVGFIPTGWYPTSVAVTPDSKTLLVGVGKGLQTKANAIPKDKLVPEKENLTEKRAKLPFAYIGTTLSGALSVIPLPGEKDLSKQMAEWTAQVYRNCPYSDEMLTGVPDKRRTAIPTKVGDPSPIKHIIYIIRENRTYDQVFGDIKEGNGDPSLVMFGEKVTPNAHKLAREYVLLDNIYCNGQVSRDGHPWSTMAYHTDYIARDWHLTYSKRIGVDDDADGNLSKGPSGYLWDLCARKGLSFRSYGEYGKRVSQEDGSARMEARVPGLVGHICPDYGVPRAKGQKVRDTDNVATFLKEYREFEKKGTMPRFIVMSLGEDHTKGTTVGEFTPAACVASNDLALGQLVEAVSKSKLWPQTAIFVIEDDAQNGPDHVDAHRTVGLVISPYTKRTFVDSTQYSTVSMIRTMELILGLPPLSQYDAAARPMFNSFTDEAIATLYVHEPARIDLNAVNKKGAYGADRSAKMDFSDYDLVDDFELNEILWRSIKGADAPIPPAVRRAIANRPATVSAK